MWLPVCIIVGCYALGCVLPAWLLVRHRTGRDVRAVGSGNAGARNAGRVLGRRIFLVVALLDIGKGVVAARVASAFGLSGWALAAAGAAVVAGHVWPAPLGFRGGKGMAAAFGVLLGCMPWVALTMLAIFGLGRWRTGQSLRPSLAAFAAGPLLALVAGKGVALAALAAGLTALLVFTHRRNLAASCEAGPAPD